MIAAHLLPLTNYVGNGQYALVQPIASKFAERCICTTLTPSNFAWERGDSAQLLGGLVRLEKLERLGSAPLDLAVRRQILGL